MTQTNTKSWPTMASASELKSLQKKVTTCYKFGEKCSWWGHPKSIRKAGFQSTCCLLMFINSGFTQPKLKFYIILNPMPSLTSLVLLVLSTLFPIYLQNRPKRHSYFMPFHSHPASRNQTTCFTMLWPQTLIPRKIRMVLAKR